MQKMRRENRKFCPKEVDFLRFIVTVISIRLLEHFQSKKKKKNCCFIYMLMVDFFKNYKN